MMKLPILTSSNSIAIAVFVSMVSLCTSQTHNGHQLVENSERIIAPKRNSSDGPRNATAVALEYCEKYQEYKYSWYLLPRLPGDPESWFKTAECWWDSLSQLPIVQTLLSDPKEFPHMALIGYGQGDPTEGIEWNCVGSLISEKFILSAAHCSTTSKHGIPQWVMLGAQDISSRKYSLPAIYKIAKIHDHPKYDPHTNQNNLALFELEITAALSTYVRPACLHTSTHLSPDFKYARIAGWGRLGTDEPRSNHLLRTNIAILDDQQCEAKFHHYNSTTMICAGELQVEKKENTACVADSGSPLQRLGKKCMYEILAVASSNAGICGDTDPSGFVNVAFYLDWIQSIVWP